MSSELTSKEIADFARTVLRHAFNGQAFLTREALRKDMPIRQERTLDYVKERWGDCPKLSFRWSLALELMAGRKQLLVETIPYGHDPDAKERLTKALNEDFINILKERFQLGEVEFSLYQY